MQGQEARAQGAKGIRQAAHKNQPSSTSNLDLFFVWPPEGGACSSWIKHGFSHSLRQRLRGVTGKWFGRVFSDQNQRHPCVTLGVLSNTEIALAFLRDYAAIPQTAKVP
jgi:hypothetical protein